MEYITFYTNAHLKELSEVMSCLIYSEIGKHDIYDTITIRRQDFDAAAFFDLLMSMAFEQNAAVKNSTKLFRKMSDSLSQAIIERQKNNLLEYIKDNTVINLEGYVKFRMNEFHSHVNFLLYAIVRGVFKNKQSTPE